MDELKKHIQLHRAELDTDEPSGLSWSNMVSKRRPVVRNLVMRWTVAASLVLATGALIYFFPAKENKTPMAVVQVDHNWDIRVARTIPAITATSDKQEKTIIQSRRVQKKKAPVPSVMYGFEGIEASYAGMLNLQRERLRMQPIYVDAAYFDLFKKQFAGLNNQEENVKQRIRKTGMQDIYFDELISIYQEKINVLKQLQLEINRINTRTRQADPDINARPPSYINL